MGWCSGTELFDAVAESIINSPLTRKEKVKILVTLIEAMEDQDWDCQQDSRYWNEPLVAAAMKVVHPSWFEGE